MSTKFFYALILTAAGIVFQLLLFFSGFQTEKLATGQYLQWFGVVIAAVVLWFGISAVRDERGDAGTTYGQRVGAGFMISLYAGLMGGVYTYVHFKFINYDFADHMLVITRQKWAAAGLTADQMGRAEGFTRTMLSPGVQAVLAPFFSIIVGLVCSLLIAAIVQPKRPAPASAAPSVPPAA